MKPLEEYLRRNLVHASSVGTLATTRAAIKRVKNLKRPQKWLVKFLEAIHRRAEPLPEELAKHRDEIKVHTIEEK